MSDMEVWNISKNGKKLSKTQNTGNCSLVLSVVYPFFCSIFLDSVHLVHLTSTD